MKVTIREHEPAPWAGVPAPATCRGRWKRGYSGSLG